MEPKLDKQKGIDENKFVAEKRPTKAGASIKHELSYAPDCSRLCRIYISYPPIFLCPSQDYILPECDNFPISTSVDGSKSPA